VTESAFNMLADCATYPHSFCSATGRGRNRRWTGWPRWPLKQSWQ